MAGKEKKPDAKQKPIIVQKTSMPMGSKHAPALSKVTVRKKRMDQPGLLAFTLLVLYKNLYILGVMVLRKRNKYIRRGKRFFQKCGSAIWQGLRRAARMVSRFVSGIFLRIKTPFLRIVNTYRDRKPAMRAKRAQGKIPVDAYIDVLEQVWRLLWGIIRTVFNYAAPVLALWILFGQMDKYLNITLGLEVVYNGQQIGYIRNETEFDAATRDVRRRVIGDVADYIKGTPQFNLQVVEENKLTSVTELADKIITTSGTVIEEAFGFYIDNTFYGAVTNEEPILEKLDEIKEENTTGKPNERVAFEKSVTLTEPGFFPQDSLVDAEKIVELLDSYETVDQIYVVQSGDSPSLIADKTGVPYSLLQDLNPDLDEAPLQVGQEILTAVARPFLPVKSIYTETYRRDVAFDTVEIENATLPRGHREVTQEGVPGIEEVTAEVTTVNGIETDRVELAVSQVRAPVEQRITTGVYVQETPSVYNPGSSSGNTDRTPALPTNNQFLWPVSSGYLSAWIGSYWGHTGIDIAGPAGSPIYAAASGTVTVAKWTYTGYGIHCIIDHGNGYSTLYAHNSDMYVGVGEYVEQGQVIAARGRTGNASGNHLHFEIRYNNAIQNPLDYF